MPLGEFEKHLLRLLAVNRSPECTRQWLAAVAEATALFLKLPPEEIGCLYLDTHGQAVMPNSPAPEFHQLRRHFGCVDGAWPAVTAS